MPIRLFPLNKVIKQKHIIEVNDEEVLEEKADEILAREKSTLSSPSAGRSNTDVLNGNSTSGYELDPKTAEIIKAAEELLAKNKTEKSIELFPLDKKSDQNLSIKDSQSEERVDPETQDVIFKLYPEKHIDAIIHSTDTADKKVASYDVLFEDAGRFIIEKNKASIGVIQRVFKIGVNRATRIMDQLADAGAVSEESSTCARKVLMTLPEFEAFLENEYDYPENKHERRKIENHHYERDWGDVHRDLWSHRVFFFSHETFRKAEEQLNKETEAFLIDKFQVPEHEVHRSFSAIENLKKHKNCLITNSKFSTPVTFVLATMKKCSPARLHLVLIDDKGYFSKFSDYYLLLKNIWAQEKYIIEILKWCIEERDKRQKKTLDKGRFEYQPESYTNELPIMIVVRELHSILQINGVREMLIQLLVNSYQFGIYLIGFSQYDRHNLGINPFRNMADCITEEEVLEIFTEDKTDHREKLPGQLFSTSRNISSRNIDTMDGISFEKYCASVLKANRFTNINVTKASGDYGADIVAVKDQIKYAIQCKRSVTPIGNKAVQEVIASRSVYNCHVGAVLTNNYFTNSAKVLAKKNNILLWDRNDLLKMSSLVTS